MKNNRMNPEYMMLEGAFAPTPDGFRSAMQKGLSAGQARRADVHRVLLVAALIVLLCGAALAGAVGIGILNFGVMDESYYYTLPGADALVQVDLCTRTVNGLRYTVREAAYDGRFLQILYSVTIPGYKAVFESDEQASAALEKACGERGTWLRADGAGEVLINGIAVNLGGVWRRAGSAPGECLVLVDSQMERSGDFGSVYNPEGDIAVSMPFSSPVNAAPLSFTLPADDAAVRYQIALPEPVQTDAGVLTVEDAFFSPISVTLRFRVDAPESIVFDSDDAAWNWFDDNVYPAMEGLVNERGESLGMLKDSGYGAARLETGGARAVVKLMFAPSDKYTDTVYLVFGAYLVPLCLKSR